jgi:hypothetical protein
MAKLRQSLLPFTSESQPDGLPKSPDPSSIPSKPPLQLPTELWDRILDPLETFAIKKFRLVCLQWSVLGAERLYSTVYLNPYESSWSGLISVSTSRYASSVKKIVWNPLELPEECLDGEIWKSRYRNLLQGLKHRQILQFHQAYAKAYRDCISFWGSSKLESIVGAMNNLRNCHEIVLSDEYDLESSCEDSYLRVGIRSDPDLLKKPTTWGLRPQMWKQTREGRDSLLAAEDIFRTLRGCHLITSLKIDFWAAHWNEIHEVLKYDDIGNPSSRRSIRTMVKYRHISELEFKVRFCEFPSLWVEGSSIQSTLGYVFACTDSFPDLRELSFTPSFSEPGHGYIEYQLESESIGDDGIALDTPARPTITASELLTGHASALALAGSVLSCVYADLILTASPLANLRTLRFSNTTLDTRLLLYWLASHKQLPGSSISIHLRDTAVLYGLDPELFLNALAQLNVRICYDRHTTFHYPLDSEFSQHIQIPSLDCYLMNRRKITTARHWSKEALCSPDIGRILEPFPKYRGMARQRSAEFLHRPDEFEQIIMDYAKNEYLTAQTVFYSYCISLDEHGTWEWARVTTDLHDLTDSGEQKRTAILVTLRLCSKHPHEYALYDDTESEILDAAIRGIEELVQDVQAKQEIEGQELLRQYETELLGLDLIEAEA